MKKVLMLLLLLSLVGCTKPGKTTKLLESQGYTNIQITGYHWTGCSDETKFHTGFKATGKNGIIMTGYTCDGLFFTGMSIHYD